MRIAFILASVAVVIGVLADLFAHGLHGGLLLAVVIILVASVTFMWADVITHDEQADS